jgi:hypothetical protein
MIDDEYITTAEVAVMLKCTCTYITVLVKHGHFPNTIKTDPSRCNSPLRILRSDVDKYQGKKILSKVKISPLEH